MSPQQARMIKLLLVNEREYYEAKLRGEDVIVSDIWREIILPGEKKTILHLQDLGLVETENRNETQLWARLTEDLEESELH